MTRDEMRRRQQIPEIGPIAEGVILALWQQGYDSLAIAMHLHVPESQVYNRLMRSRERARG